MEMSGKLAAAASKGAVGGELLMGFRPEHLELANGAGSGALRMPASVDVVEYLGNEELIHAKVEDVEIVAMLTSERPVKVGQQIELAIPMEKLHVFDPETELSLSES
jgi:multiple sugar transport system ATP-binding protein